ncbi:hypothetical protein [Flavobacterium xanthum]|uniref:Uncharacterized protein n=1 Tax=Flavobacterium xanthum TaxID=69322 RepID=A0A1M6X935_9FLAO|nr:hypothetical protein [Flavobacterium xanthum]SHL02512.1 hypothetical protein SAMN05443669_1001176 [Flavobacterium xanthum]
MFFSLATLITFGLEMRVTIFFLYLFFHLLGGGNVVHATSHDNGTASVPKSFVLNKDQVKLLQSVPGSLSITSAEFDLEEEGPSSESFKSTTATIATGKYHLSEVWYLTFSCQSILNHYSKNFKIFAPSCGQSNPIYIVQQVLRI